jgi:hypothetical protein
MRAFGSYLIGIFTLAGLIAAGGAVAAPTPSLSVVMGPADAALFATGLDAAIPAEPSPLLTGCRPPVTGAVCLPGDLVQPAPPPPPSPYDLVPVEVESVEDWRPLVEMFFETADADRAIRVIACESKGVSSAKNPSSTASGLFQHLASQWRARSAKAGWAGSDVFDPVANVAVAAWLVYEGGGWSHWNASSGCW